MMDPILISAAFGALVAIGATVAIERFGGRAGGLIGSMPSTIIPASIGFFLSTDDAITYQDALHAVPAGMMVNACFLYAWRVLPRWIRTERLTVQLTLVSFCSLVIWGLLAAGFVLLMRETSLPSVYLGGGFFVLQLGFGIWACRENPPAPKGAQRVRPVVLASRGLLAGTAIGAAVWISSLGIPFLAGMASIFPAIFLTTMVSVWLAQGRAVQAGAVGPMMLGSAAVSGYALAASALFPSLGPGWGAVAAWFIAVGVVSWPVWLWLQRNKRS